jgi:hypothetical protein
MLTQRLVDSSPTQEGLWMNAEVLIHCQSNDLVSSTAVVKSLSIELAAFASITF